MKELQIPSAYDFESGICFDVELELYNKDLVRIAQHLYNLDYWGEKELVIKNQYFPTINIKKLCCYNCRQFLELSISSRHRAFLKHKSGSDDCDLKNGSAEENKEIIREHIIKESEEHYNLKNRLGNALKRTSNVSNVIIDRKFLSTLWEKRKPDVICEFKDVALVFEFQVSDLPLRTIKGRTQFYETAFYNGKPTFLVWVLNENHIKEIQNADTGKNKYKQSSTAKRIKYQSEHHNYFTYEDNSHDYVKLACLYKRAFIKESVLEIYLKWRVDQIELPSLKFDHGNRIAYYKDIESQKDELKPDLELLIHEKKLNSIRLKKEWQEWDRIRQEENRLLEIRKASFQKMHSFIHESEKELKEISSSVNNVLKETLLLGTILDDISKIEIESVIEYLGSNNYHSNFSLNFPQEFYNEIKSLFKEYDLYNLNQTLSDYKNGKRYIAYTNILRLINSLKTVSYGSNIYYEISKLRTPKLFTEKYSKQIFYYEKKDREDLFGIIVKQKHIYDDGSNPLFIYLYDFSEEIKEATEHIQMIERIIDMATDNYNEQRAYLKRILNSHLASYTADIIRKKEEFEQRRDVFENQYWKYIEVFESNIPDYFCSYFDAGNRMCKKGYQYNEYNICMLYSDYYISKDDFCDNFEVQNN